MSGTSLDGIDLACIKFKLVETWTYEVIHAETIPYDLPWQKELAEAIGYEDDLLEELNERYTSYLAAIIADFIAKNNIDGLEAICSHGHTIKHEPENGFTLQIGNLRKLADTLGKTVVCDFRVQDVQLGGQGAPLVPVGDELLFGDFEYCLNLGGFANISTRMNSTRVAFDICAVNTVLNYLSSRLGMSYDENGAVAASGERDERLLDDLNGLPFYRQTPPKSLGIEWVNANLLPLIASRKDIPVLLHTYVLHAAQQIAKVLDQKTTSKVLVTGGGAFNTFLIQEIRSRTENEIIIPSTEVVNYKEAIIFGFLGVLKLRGEVNVLKSVTGASKDHSSGIVYRPQD